MQPITPLTTREYFDEITTRISQAGPGDRIALINMTLEPDAPGMPKLIEAITGAASRGADVLLVVDAWAFMMTPKGWPTGPVFWKRPIASSTSRRYHSKLEVLEELRAQGGRYCIINMPTERFINPYAGRSHLKITIINDQAYLGGCNLSGNGLIDVMLRLDNHAIANWLHDQAWAIIQAKSTRIALAGNDQTCPVDPQTRILLDSGQPGQSLIYDEALRLIDQARTYVFMTCQFFPDDKTVNRLEAAIKRGVDVTLYFNHPSKQEQPPRLAHRLLLLRAKLRRSQLLFSHELPKNHAHLHLKLIATEQGAILGSHNYVNAGVQFGTAEIALIRRDPGFGEELIQKIRPFL
jgi:cardiolipin synthase A/B